MRKLDIFNHVLPVRFFERIGDYKDIGKRMREVPMLYDLDTRFRVMDRFPEYEQVLSAGMPPIDVLRAATSAPADFLDAQHRFGRVREGQRADLLLVQGDPTENIAATEAIVAVFADGSRLSRTHR